MTCLVMNSSFDLGSHLLGWAHKQPQYHLSLPLSCENAGLGCSVKSLTRAILPLIGRHEQPASFPLPSTVCLPSATLNCQYQLCWPQLSHGRESLWTAASEDITQNFGCFLFILLAEEKKKNKTILPVTLIQNQRDSLNVTFYKYLPMSQLTFPLYPVG